MGFFDRFKKKQVNPNIFSFLLGSASPDMKGNEYLAAYKGWVYACVNAIAEEVATIDLKLQRLTSNGWVDIENHLAITTLHDVNSFMSSSDLLLHTQAFLELEGNAFWYLPRGKATNKPAEIWLLDPTRTLVVKSATNFISGYVYRNEVGQNVPFNVTEILHFKRFNPRNRYRGLGTVAAAALAIDTDTYSAEWNRNFFYNSAMPSATLETAGTLTKEQLDRIKAEFDARYKGVDNAHKLAILQGGLTFKPITLSQRDMEFLEQRRFTRDEILGIFRVPKTALLITEDVNRANAEATDYVFSKRVIKPRMEFITDQLNEFYLPMFGESLKSMRFVFTDPVPQNIELKLKEKETGIRAGYYTINEVREEEGLDPVDGGDVVYLPINLIPIGQPRQNTTEVNQQTIQIKSGLDAVEKRVRFIRSEITEKAQEYRTILLEQKSYLLRKLKNQKKKIVKADLGVLLDVALADFDDDWVKVLVTQNKKSLTTATLYAGREALRNLDSDRQFTIENPRAVEWLRDNALTHARSVLDTIKEEVRNRIATGVSEGRSINEIAEHIGEFFDEQSQWRALRIARTEVISGYAEGSIEGYRQSGVVKGKRWLTANDDRVDDECAENEADGAIGLESNFSTGHSAPPVHPNCRCTLQPEV
jgi:HK97 family phage portal protein